MNFIAVDIGSTFVKAALFDMDSRRIRSIQKFSTPEKRKTDDASIFENNAAEFVTVIQKIIAQFCETCPQVVGVLFSTQQHGCVLSHPDLAEDVYISWQDTRCLHHRPGSSRSYLEELEEKISRCEMERCGVYLKPAMALCNLYALFESGALKASREARLYTLGSYIIEKLTGNNICHITNAAPMGFADIVDGSWRTDLLERAGLDFLQLPAITRELKSCGTYRSGNICLPVFPDVGDVQTSVFGTGAGAGDMVINIATSGQMVYLTPELVPGNYEIRPYYDNNYCCVISRMPGGRNFDVQIDYLRDIGERLFGVALSRGEIWDRIHALHPGRETDGIAVDCGFYELPDRLADGSIRHIDHGNFTVEHVIAATAQDFGRQYRRFARQFCTKSEFKGTLYFAGGAVLKNPLLQAAIQEEMGQEKVMCAPSDEVYNGMFRLAQSCLADGAPMTAEKGLVLNEE